MICASRLTESQRVRKAFVANFDGYEIFLLTSGWTLALGIKRAGVEVGEVIQGDLSIATQAARYHHEKEYGGARLG